MSKIPASKSSLPAQKPAGMTPQQRKRAAELCQQLPLIQHELFQLGLPITSAHMAKTIEKLGYELCHADLKAGRVTPSEERYRAHLLKTEGKKAVDRHYRNSLKNVEKMLHA